MLLADRQPVGEELCMPASCSRIPSSPGVALHRTEVLHGEKAVNRPDLTIATFERLIDRGVPVPMIGDGTSRFHVRRHDHRASCDTAREFSLMRGWRG
jgi:hypothetical protein